MKNLPSSYDKSGVASASGCKENSKRERLAKALRDNLKRRKRPDPSHE